MSSSVCTSQLPSTSHPMKKLENGALTRRVGGNSGRVLGFGTEWTGCVARRVRVHAAGLTAVRSARAQPAQPAQPVGLVSVIGCDWHSTDIHTHRGQGSHGSARCQLGPPARTLSTFTTPSRAIPRGAARLRMQGVDVDSRPRYASRTTGVRRAHARQCPTDPAPVRLAARRRDVHHQPEVAVGLAHAGHRAECTLCANLCRAPAGSDRENEA